MKPTTLIQIAAFLALALTWTAAAQGPQGREPGDRPDGMRPPPPEEMVADMLLDFDIDSDGKLDELELEEAIVARRRPPDPMEIATDWVETYDVDWNGELSPEELAEALEANRPRHGHGGPRPPRKDRGEYKRAE